MRKKNKFIATFMSNKNKSRVYKYDKSWSWLMPVVDKINTLYDTHDLFIFSGIVEKMRHCVSYVDREGAYDMIIEFIKLYNTINNMEDEPKRNNK